MSLFDNCKNSKQQGDLGLSSAIFYFSTKGYTVSLPLTDSQPYDLIFDNGSLQRTQVKTATHKRSGNYVVNLRTMGGNRKEYWCKKIDKSLIEYIFVLCDNGDQYLIPVENLKSINGLTINSSCDKFKI